MGLTRIIHEALEGLVPQRDGVATAALQVLLPGSRKPPSARGGARISVIGVQSKGICYLP
jgi:hypothetical protein